MLKICWLTFWTILYMNPHLTYVLSTKRSQGGDGRKVPTCPNIDAHVTVVVAVVQDDDEDSKLQTLPSFIATDLLQLAALNQRRIYNC